MPVFEAAPVASSLAGISATYCLCNPQGCSRRRWYRNPQEPPAGAPLEASVRHLRRRGGQSKRAGSSRICARAQRAKSRQDSRFPSVALRFLRRAHAADALLPKQFVTPLSFFRHNFAIERYPKNRSAFLKGKNYNNCAAMSAKFRTRPAPGKALFCRTTSSLGST